jgi:probable HAF family extracellular repeat protein
MSISIKRLAGVVVLGLGAISLGLCQQFSIEVLSTYDGSATNAHGLNEKGQVVGEYVNSNGALNAVIWENGGWQELGILSDGADSRAKKINNNGNAVGSARDVNGNWRPVVYDKFGIRELQGLSGNFGFANDINDSDLIVGSYTRAGGGAIGTSWNLAGEITELGGLGTGRQEFTDLLAVNKGGVVAGSYFFLFSPYRAVAMKPGDKGFTDLGAPGRSDSQAYGINDNGDVVGGANDGSGSRHAAIFDWKGGFQDLGTLDGDTDSQAYDINNKGWVVGESFNFMTGDFKAFLSVNGHMTALNDLIDPNSGWTGLEIAEGVNDQGWIVGSGFYQGEVRGFLMKPVPEPATMAALGLGLAALVRRRKR